MTADDPVEAAQQRVATMIREAEDAALEKAAKKMQALCEKNSGRHFCTGIAGEPCDFAAAIRAIKAQQLPKMERQLKEGEPRAAPFEPLADLPEKEK